MTRTAQRLGLLSLVFAVLVARPAFADEFVSLPELGGKSKQLKVRLVRYDGSTNGRMVVDVKNSGKTTTAFVAEGLYFVPEGKPDQAPQRLGAAGPFVVTGGKRQAAHVQKLALKPGEVRRIELEVFCIDSHRSSPSNQTKFSIAKKRLPKQLRQQITEGAAKAIRDNKGDVARSKGAIQSNTWQVRDDDWIPLEGERKQEKAPAKTQQQR
jgi:hypothetical protein